SSASASVRRRSASARAAPGTNRLSAAAPLTVPSPARGVVSRNPPAATSPSSAPSPPAATTACPSAAAASCRRDAPTVPARGRTPPGGDEGKHREQGLCWRAEDDGVAGVEGSEIERGRGVHGPLVDRQVPGARVDVDSGDPGIGSRTPQRERERAADEAEADDD